jgi:hypothetical protein
MKKGLLFLLALFCIMPGRAQQVVDNIASATEDFVYNKADSKVYAKNSSGSYEEYGVVPRVQYLRVASAPYTDIEYIETTTKMFDDWGAENVPYINTGYKPKSNTKIVLECNITENTKKDWEALFGARQSNWTQKAFVLFSRTGKDSGGNKGCYNRTNSETVGSTVIPMGQRIKVEASGNTATFTKDGATSAAATITASGTVEDCTNSLYIFDLNTAGADGNSRDKSVSFMKLYSFKIYEGETLVMDLQPIVSSDGKGGLRDKVGGGTYYSAVDGRNFQLSPDGQAAFTPVYNGKVIHCLEDGQLYKYTNGSLSNVGSMVVEGNYTNMTNWTCPDSKTGCFASRFYVDGRNRLDPYRGSAYNEPFHTSVSVTSGKKYNFSFRFSCDAWDTWQGDKSENNFMRAVVLNTVSNDQDFTENGNSLGGSNGVLARSSLPHTATTDQLISMDFTAAQATENLLLQFGFVADAVDYRFCFDNIIVQKLEDYPSGLYLNMEEAIKTIAYAKGKGTDTSAADAALQTASSQTEVNAARDAAVLALKQHMAEKSTQPTIFTMISESVVGTDDNNYATYSVDNRADGFYIYNVGTGRWFCGGDDWGAHAAVGFPGIKVTTPKNTYESGHYNSIVTWLCNGNWGVNNQLNHSGYCDTSGNGWKFFKQDAANGIYTWAKNGDNKGNNSGNGYGTKELVGFAPSTYARVNTNCTDATDPYNQWIFVTEAQRDAMAAAAMATASESNPVDLTYKIKMPGFNQRERKEGTNQDSEQLDWTCNHANYKYSDGRLLLMGRNDNHADFVCDVYGYSWNDAFSWTQTVTGLTPGRYRVKVQGYNNGGDAANKAYLVANGQKSTLVERSSESVLPWTTKLPENTFDNPEYFQVGCYWNEVLCTVGSNGELTLGVQSPNVTGGHVIIFDNFRLEYVGLVGATVGDADYTTFVAPYNISEIPDGVEAYACQVQTDYVHLELVEAIPEGEAVVLKNTGTYSFSPASGSVSLGTDNDMLASDGSVTGAAGNIYALASKNDVVGFYLVGSDVTVPVGKGYLIIPNEVKPFYGFGEDDATSISEIENGKLKVESSIYNLAGQRISKTQKGVNIVNGRKALF